MHSGDESAHIRCGRHRGFPWGYNRMELVKGHVMMALAWRINGHACPLAVISYVYLSPLSLPVLMWCSQAAGEVLYTGEPSAGATPSQRPGSSPLLCVPPFTLYTRPKTS